MGIVRVSGGWRGHNLQTRLEPVRRVSRHAKVNAVVRRLGSDCAQPIRILLIGGAACFLFMAAAHWYSNRAEERNEKRRRIFVLFAASVMAFAGVMFLQFASICTLDPGCRKGVDLNCTGPFPRIYEGFVLGFALVFLATVTGEVAYRVRRN